MVCDWGAIQGGLYGDWPGLAQMQLRDGRFLDSTIDYRDIYAEILTQHLSNNNTESLLPNYTPTRLGLFTG